MVSDAPINPTQLAGLLAFGAVALAAAWAARAGAASGPSGRATWRWVCFFQLLFVVEIWLSNRHVAHDMVNTWLHSVGLYQDRARLQQWMLAGIGLCGALAAWAWWRSAARDRPRATVSRLALVSTGATLMLFLVETVSLHAVDRLLYRPVGPVLLIACFWIAHALAVVALAWRAATAKC